MLSKFGFLLYFYNFPNKNIGENERLFNEENLCHNDLCRRKKKFLDTPSNSTNFEIKQTLQKLLKRKGVIK